MVTPHTRFCPHAKKKLKPPCKLHHVLWQLKGFKYRFQAALETSEKLKDKKKKRKKLTSAISISSSHVCPLNKGYGEKER